MAKKSVSKEPDGRIYEEHLYKPVREFLIKQGYTVHAEVKDCDVAAMKGEELVVVELKKSLSIELLIQAVKRQKIADSVYIAVPKPKKLLYTRKWEDICHLVRRLELGLILVSFYGDKSTVDVILEPIHFDRLRSVQKGKTKRARLIKEFEGRHGDRNVGGSTGKKLMTAYKEGALYIACCLRKYGDLTPKKLRELGADLKKTTSILSNNYYGWFYNVRKGLYGLTEEGLKALTQHNELAVYYDGLIETREREKL